MAKIKGAIIVDVENCKGCALCIESCPSDVIKLSDDVNSKGYNYAVPFLTENCIGCANCGMVCPDSCITVYKKKFEN